MALTLTNPLTAEEEKVWTIAALKLKEKVEGIGGKNKNPMMYYVKETIPDNACSHFASRIVFSAIHETTC